MNIYEMRGVFWALGYGAFETSPTLMSLSPSYFLFPVLTNKFLAIESWQHINMTSAMEETGMLRLLLYHSSWRAIVVTN
jgi:hypothetical protein